MIHDDSRYERSLMSPRGALRLARALAAITFAGVIAAAGFGLLLSGSDVALSDGHESFVLTRLVVGAVGVTFAVIGTLIVSRHPENPIGWILLVFGVSVGTILFAEEYSAYALLARPGSLPGGEAMLWLYQWVSVGTMPAGNLLLLLFPNGRLLSARWRPVVWLAFVGMIGVFLHEAFAPGLVDVIALENPLGLGGAAGDVAAALAFSYALVIASTIAGVASLGARMRRSSGEERQQLKWLASGAFVQLVGVLASRVPGAPEVLPIFVGQAAMAVAVGVGILKYRLYDIDVVINRALVYGALTAMLAGTYLGSVLLLQLVLSTFTSGGGLAVAASTLAVAALFQPARRRIQARVDRRFFRSKYDAQRTLERFGAQLRDEVGLEALGSELRAVVTETMQPTHVTLWLRAPEPGR